MVGPLSGFVAFALIAHLWWRAGALPFFGHDFTGPVWLRLEDSQAIVLDAILLAGYFASHSWLASLGLKARLGLSPESHRRLFLIGTALGSAVLWTLWAPLPAPLLWEVTGPAAWIFHAVQALGLVGFVWTGRHFDIEEFLGRRGPRAGAPLSFAGPFALVRHPSYFFTLCLFVAPVMPLGRALLAFGALAYIIIGSRIEEGKLRGQFGAAYSNYARQTPWLVPTPRSIRRAFSEKA